MTDTTGLDFDQDLSGLRAVKIKSLNGQRRALGLEHSGLVGLGKRRRRHFDGMENMLHNGLHIVVPGGKGFSKGIGSCREHLQKGGRKGFIWE